MYCMKAGWDTKELADSELARIRSKRIPNQWKVPIRSYQCRCGAWHLTSQPKKEAHR